MSQSLDVRFRTRQEIEALAEEIRLQVGVIDVPVDAGEIARHLDLAVEYVDFDQGDVAGQIIRSGGEAEIRVRGTDPPRRRSFTIAHEIGHHLLHPADEWSDTEATMYRLDYWGAGAFLDRDQAQGEEAVLRRAEVQANAFAAALLMPEAKVREWWNKVKSIDMILPKFEVSRPAMRRRLQELGLIVPSVEGFHYADLSSLAHATTPPASPPLADEQGPIPSFPPIALDDQGRIVPLDEQDRRARQDALMRTLRAIDEQGRDDPPGLAEAVERGIDEHRPHRKLFGDE